MASFLITGTSRGLGLALAKRLASLPTSQVGTIFATARQDNSPLNELISHSSGRVEFVNLDVTSTSSVQEASQIVDKKLQGKGLDYLINNAGALDWNNDGVVGM